MTTIGTDASYFEVLFRGTRFGQSALQATAHIRSAWKSRLHCVCHWRQLRGAGPQDVYVVLPRQTLLDDRELEQAQSSPVRSRMRLLILPDQSPPESLLERIFQLKIRSETRIHTPRLDVDTRDIFLRRFLTTLALSPSQQTVTDAWWEQDELVLLSPTFTRLKVPKASIPKMRNASPSELAMFEIDEEGEFLYWPSHDVHMGWPQFEQAVKPEAKLKTQQRSEAFNKRYGAAVRALREESGLRQSAIPGLTDRTVRRIEQGRTRATAGALAKLAAAHGMATNAYLGALAARLDAAVAT